MSRPRFAVLLTLALLVAPARAADDKPNADPGPKSPQAGLASLKLRPGFVAELVAAEPLVQDPIAIAWGPDGKLWVAEMGDYPLGTDGKGKFGGRILCLEDTDGDGRYDKSTVFLDNLGYPTGVLPWRKGVLVTCAPEIFYAEDTDGDGKADVRIPLYTGFREGNQQHRVNGLRWGLDNWVYGANGDSGGVVRPVKPLTPGPSPPRGEGRKPVDLRGHDFRIRPDAGAIELVSGQTQYGRAVSDWGDWFGGNNANPAWHYVLDDHYLRRSSHLAPPEPRVPLLSIPTFAPVFPASRTLPRFNDPHTANRFTSACGIEIYRDELFGPAFASNLFVCEPVHNLVHREVVTAEGVTFKSHRADDEQRSEFLASTDNWCRPVMARTGPDGALWVVDMYRYVIEHPEWIPLDWQKKLDLRAGHDQGRIYRVYPAGVKPRAIPRLDKLDTAGLVAALDHPNGWQRDMAQQMLIWRCDQSAGPLLEKLAATAQRPQARLHALCTLDGLNLLRPAVLQKALADPHPGVRRHAVRLSEPLLNQARELGSALAALVHDPDSQVQMQLAYSLGAWDDPQAGTALGELAVRSADDRYMTAAVLSSVRKQNLEAMLRTVLHRTPGGAGPSPRLVEELLRQADALGDTRATVTLLDAVSTADNGKYAPWQFTALAGLLDSLDRRRTSLSQLAAEGDGALKSAVARLTGLFAAARMVAADAAASPIDRAQAVRLLGRGTAQQSDDLDRLAGLLVPQTPDEVQTAAVAALGRLRSPEVPARLLHGWAGYGPGLRAQVFDLLARREDWLRAALDAIERKEVPAAEIDAARRQQLLRHTNATVRARAERLFGGAASPDRQKVIDAYQSVMTLKGDPARGQPLFVKHCANCHKLGGVGGEVGPDLTPLADKPADYLLTNILDPNRAVEPRYISYLAETKAGLTLTGVLAGESGNRLTLLGNDGKPQVVLRSELQSLTSTGRSAMPEGLEKDVSPQDIADIIAHLRAAVPHPSAAGPRRGPIKPGPDGEIWLRAADSTIHGAALVVEPKHGNLGHWVREDDRASWVVEVPKAGRYAVWLEWACDDKSAGNRFDVQVTDGDRLGGRVAGTGGWDNYQQAKVGELELKAGWQEVAFVSGGWLKGTLINLKSVRLVPVATK